ncbi:phosphate ABC transporter permease PstA [Euzebya tangerina]|uniref:phosphate ABC transporter permease PstA n=1 Tax=Euzebya tangerina TaxID=591198 RepID=UPI000E311893|nr:phosphate ABC transporter permease PstA [Euzebya tangerina]
MSSPASLLQRESDTSPDLQSSPKKRARARRFEVGLLIATIVSVIVLAWLLIDIVSDGAGRVNATLFTEYTSRFAEETGVRAGITGTLSLMVLVALMAFPIGVAAALYLEEFAEQNRWTRAAEANINNLAGVPSVVYGLLGFGIFVGILGFDRSLIVGAITLSLLILPVIIVAARESLRAVPQEMRNGGLALGATPIQVAFTITLPAAISGVFTGTILALSRAIGETAPILVAGAVFSRRADNVPWGVTDRYTALPIQVFDFVKRPQPEFQIEVSAAGIIVLMVLLLSMNSIAIYLRNRYTKEY